MRSRLARYLGAYCAIVALLFGQFALAAYVCPTQTPLAPTGSAPAAMHAEGGIVPCGAMSSPADTPDTNACEVHCSDGATSSAQPDLPPVVLAVLPVPALALAKLGHSSEKARTPYAALPGAPPLHLQFCRLLI